MEYSEVAKGRPCEGMAASLTVFIIFSSLIGPLWIDDIVRLQKRLGFRSQLYYLIAP